MPEQFFIHQKNNRVCVHQYGSGSKVIIAFHGFGESGRSFQEFETVFGKKFTLYAPDLPLHGQTKWDDRCFTPRDLELLIEKILQRSGAIRFSVLGYSMGGRMALCLFQRLISQTDALILLAPEGLKKNFWFNFSTGTAMGRLLFRYTTFHPALFHFSLRLANRFNWINGSTAKFVSQYMITGKGRRQVYQLWMKMRKMKPDISAILQQSRIAHTPVFAWFGRFDRLVPPATGKVLQSLPQSHVRIVQKGHQLLIPEIIKEIYKNITSEKEHKG